MSVTLWAAQAIGTVAAALMLHTFWRPTDAGLRARMSVVSALWVAQFALLGAPVAAAMAAIATLRMLAASRMEAVGRSARLGAALAFAAASGLGCFWFWKGVLDLVPTLLTMEMTFAYFLCWSLWLRVCQMGNSAGYIAYGCLIGAWPNVIMQCLLVVSNARGMLGMQRGKRLTVLSDTASQ